MWSIGEFLCPAAYVNFRAKCCFFVVLLLVIVDDYVISPSTMIVSV